MSFRLKVYKSKTHQTYKKPENTSRYISNNLALNSIWIGQKYFNVYIFLESDQLVEEMNPVQDDNVGDEVEVQNENKFSKLL